MAVQVIDFETYYDSEYSLSKMQMDEYILDPRFEIILVGINNRWFSGTHAEIANYIRAYTNPAEDIFVAHNAPFDGFILTQILGIRPARWVDTISLARAALPFLEFHSLGKLAEYFKIPAKMGYILNSVKGKHRVDLMHSELKDLAEYCLRDVAITWNIYEKLIGKFPPHELDLIDMTVRMFTEPRIALNATILASCYNEELRIKQDLLDQTATDKAGLMSNPQFAVALEKLGVDPPMKVSPRTGKETFAFAKSDKAFTALLEHENPDVQALVAARLGVKSTIAETRALCMLKTARRGKGLFPVALNYWGAKITGRYSGTNKVNAQNIPARGRGSEMRHAMIAPPGKMIVVGDSANIELRVAMTCAKQNDAVRKLINKEDLYCDFASLVYNRPITKADKDERFLGKVAMLSLQYGVGAVKFRETIRLLMKKDIGEAEAERIVRLYRDTYQDIISFWRYCDNVVLTAIHNRDEPVPVDRHSWFWTTSDGFRRGEDLGIVYNNLGRDSEGGWRYAKGKLYGGKVLENLAQHMARHIVMWQTAAINKLYPVSLSVHDEVLCVVDEKDVDDCMRVVEGFLSTAPPWCRGYLPLGAEVHVGKSYGEAKT